MLNNTAVVYFLKWSSIFPKPYTFAITTKDQKNLKVGDIVLFGKSKAVVIETKYTDQPIEKGGHKELEKRTGKNLTQELNSRLKKQNFNASTKKMMLNFFNANAKGD